MLRAHDQDTAEDFPDWPAAAIRALRAMGTAPAGTWMTTADVEDASARLGERISYATARNGIRWLIRGSSRYLRGQEALVFAEESARRGSAVQRLTDVGRNWARASFELYPPGSRKDGKPTVRLQDLLRRTEFAPFGIFGLRVMRVLADGADLETRQIEAATEQLDGHRLLYQQARTGCRALLDYLADGSRREYGTWDKPVDGAVAIESYRVRSYTRLTPLGLALARRALELAPAIGTNYAAEPAEEMERTPPDPITPLWRVLYDEGEALVIAADAQQAIALFEKETAEQAHRAEGVDTTAPVLLNWTLR